jgi:protein-S-isoprenylcysteine O-methyltransferase Ste14
MKIVATLLKSRLLMLASNAILTAIWIGFAYAHVTAFQETGNWIYSVFFISETFIGLMFLLRSDPTTVSTDPADWIIAISATIAPLLLSPSSEALFPAAKFGIGLGVLIQIIGLLSLNRSFGIVPAKREIKTSGLYGLVRHPLYASYIISDASYVLTNTSTANLLLCTLILILLYIRLRREELHLGMDESYRRYMEKVPYQVIPFVL